MTLSTPFGDYRWIENWMTIPDSELGRTSGRTHGMACTKEGNIVLFYQGTPSVLILDPAGQVAQSWGEYPGAHAATLVEENGEEFLWLVDHDTRAVEKTTLNGKVVQKIEKPNHPAYKEGVYMPTWVAVNEVRHGGNGDIWLADGYGSGLIHRFDAKGEYLLTLDGTEGAGKLSCPHAVNFDTRNGKSGRLYIADRGNKRFQVYDGEGKFLSVFGEDFLHSPDCLVIDGDRLVVPELYGRVAVLGAGDELLGYLGANDGVHLAEGWPNDNALEEGKFNSPHGGTVDAQGNIYIVEWRVGGRVIKLERLK